MIQIKYSYKDIPRNSWKNYNKILEKLIDWLHVTLPQVIQTSCSDEMFVEVDVDTLYDVDEEIQEIFPPSINTVDIAESPRAHAAYLIYREMKRRKSKGIDPTITSVHMRGDFYCVFLSGLLYVIISHPQYPLQSIVSDVIKAVRFVPMPWVHTFHVHSQSGKPTFTTVMFDKSKMTLN